MFTEQSGSEACWYVLHTRSRHEKLVRDELTKRGIENYLPVFHQSHQWKDRRKTVELPIFSGYVFTRFRGSPENRIHILRTPGAVRILGNADGIEPVPDSELEAVRRILVTRNDCTPHPFLKAGVWVQVRRGPLKGLEGWLVQIKNKGRLVVSVNLLSQSVGVDVEINDVEVLSRRGEYRLETQGDARSSLSRQWQC